MCIRDRLYYPGVKRQPAGTANYYGFHVATEEGFETLKAIAAFLTERYSSLQSPYGRVSNWVIGNEINNQLWNYMGPMSLEQYMEEYVRAFRVFYTAIRSTSSTSRVFFSTDYNWLHEADGRLKYNAKDVLDTFNSMVVPGGPMDWELAYHPYSIPMVEPEFWNDAETGLIKNDASSPVAVSYTHLDVYKRQAASQIFCHIQVHIQVIAAVSGTGPGNFAFIIPDKGEHVTNQGNNISGRVISSQKQVEASPAAHWAEIKNTILKQRMISQEGRPQMFYGMNLRGIHHRLKVGAGHPQIKGGDNGVSGMVFSGNINAGKKF